MGVLRRLLIVFAAICTFAAAVPAPGDNPPTVAAELEKLRGAWAIKKVTISGEEVAAENQPKAFVFNGTKLTPDDDPEDFAVVTLDPKQVPPAIDLVSKKREKSLGIYEIDGETLKLCFNEPGGARPQTFASAKGSRVSYIILKRMNK
ncbi:TIGR03067 domain-containing protein [Humisphaera borealis]|uniref:TIGR03067 domain-containing protein n=1 Tax=Humisphaera borealis TaxID=2807512 RepID=A0A7M2X190_9BACT|nr:TIGR03067 domain-containing protein [Humisphaera borealis]QOV91212.1 TIGR03067 domain-containing protein [Humisphaera borealis]